MLREPSRLTPSAAFQRFMRKGALRLTLVLLAVTLGPGCGSGGDSGRDGGGYDASAAATHFRIAVVPKGTTHVFWKSIHAGALQGAEALKKEGVNVEVLWQGPLKEDDREMQIQVLESFVGQNVAGIVVAPLDEHALVRPVNAAMSAGKPVVIFDSGLKGRNYVSFVATDNQQGGSLAAEHMGRLLGGDGKVLLLRYQVGSASTTNREEGFIATLKKKHPGITLVPPGLEQYAGATVGHAQNAAETLLNTYSDIDGIFCPNESSTTGMLQALRNTPLNGKVKLVGFDANDKLVDALAEGNLHGLILQDPVKMGHLGVRTLVDHLLGKEVEKRIDTGVFLVTKDNMKEPEIARLLKPDLSILDGR